jgi:hypothetical protein
MLLVIVMSRVLDRKGSRRARRRRDHAHRDGNAEAQEAALARGGRRRKPCRNLPSARVSRYP